MGLFTAIGENQSSLMAMAQTGESLDEVAEFAVNSGKFGIEATKCCEGRDGRHCAVGCKHHEHQTQVQLTIVRGRRAAVKAVV